MGPDLIHAGVESLSGDRRYFRRSVSKEIVEESVG
jgi:hypothetical protein